MSGLKRSQVLSQELSIDGLDRKELEDLANALEGKHFRAARKRFTTLYPETGPLRRELYAKHMEFFESGAEYRERCAMCANRVGKTYGMGAYELTCHLTGIYPDWWVGRKFDTPVEVWAAGKTNETTRDIVQSTLVGNIAHSGNRKTVDGTGMIPGDLLCLDDHTWKAGVPDLLDTIKIKHVSGQRSLLGIKSYQQGRGSFEGTAKHAIWCDEEPPVDIYGECVIRTATVQGIIFITFTPREGMSEVVLSFMPQGTAPE